MKYIHDFKVISNTRENDEFVVLTLQYTGDKLPEMTAGQFAEVRIDHTPAVYLRRPLSIHDVDYNKKEISFLIQEVGEGTRWLTKLKSGNSINLIYPLGKGYKLPSNKEDSVLLVGGGCGVAPLLYLGRTLFDLGIKPRFLIGVKRASSLVRLDEYRRLGEVMVTTEDGSYGHKGFVIDHPVMKTENPDFKHIYTCGPEAMMKELAKYAHKHNISCQVSLENLMACGFGVCLCCVTATIEGHKCTCTDGPVFDSKYLQWQI